MIAASVDESQLLWMPLLPKLLKSAAEYRSDAERCRRLAVGVGERDAALMMTLAATNNQRAAQADASERIMEAKRHVPEHSNEAAKKAKP